jgi:hypothetical protein
MHKALVSRLRSHGGVNLDPPEMIQAEVGFTPKGYGLGYYEDGELTHFLWFDVRGQHGPYVVTALAYRTPDQLLELLALLKSLADQVTSVTMMEPPHVQLQSLLKQPFRTRRLTRRSEHGNEHKSMAWWQIRLLDLAVLARYCWRGEPLRFNLELMDPIEMQLSDQAAGSWRGIAGSYQVELASSSAVTAGVDPQLPTLRASVNALSRLYFGAARASVLAVGSDFSAPAALIARLDEVFCMPQPSAGWDF